MEQLFTNLISIVTTLDRYQQTYIPPEVARILIRSGFIPHRSYLRAPPVPPPPPRPICPSMTRRGTQCTNRCAINQPTCMIHCPNPTPRPIPPNEYRCTAHVANGELCKNSRYSIYPMCMRHARKANLLPPPPEVPSECAICYNNLSDGARVKTSCGHYFHGQCFDNWRTTRTRDMRPVYCPMCRNSRPNPRAMP